MVDPANQEIEWQFDLDDLDQVRNLLTEFLKTLPYKKTFKKRVTQIDTYYDVDDCTFYNGGFSLRIRKQGKTYEAAFKSLLDTRDEGVVRARSRVELAQKLAGPGIKNLLKAKGALGKMLRCRHPKTVFKELFVLATERERILLATGDKPFAEIALDHATMMNDPNGHYPLELLRLEIEVKDAAYMLTVQDIVNRLKQFLRAKHAKLTPSTLSKFQVAFLHCRIKPFLRDFGPYSFEKTMSIERYIVSVCKKYLEAAFHNEAGCRLGHEVEFVHRMRVALRKVLSAFKVFFDHVPAKLIGYRVFLKNVISHLGDVRDLDVHLAALTNAQELTESHGREPVDEIIATLKAKREKAHDELLKIFNSKTYARMVRSLAMTINDPNILTRETKSAGTIYPSMAKQIIKEFHSDGQKLDVNAKPKRFHKVRIKGKELRYTFEFFKPLAEKTIAELIEIMTAIQDNLGAINDSRVAKERLITLSGREARRLSPLALFVMGEACMQSIDSEKDNRKKFVEGFADIPWAKLAKKISPI